MQKIRMDNLSGQDLNVLLHLLNSIHQMKNTLVSSFLILI